MTAVLTDAVLLVLALAGVAAPLVAWWLLDDRESAEAVPAEDVVDVDVDQLVRRILEADEAAGR